MRTRHVLVVLLMAVLPGCSQGEQASSGASSEAQPTTTTASKAPTTTSSPKPTTPKTSQFRLGEPASGGCAAAECELTFTITKMTDCAGGYEGDPPPSGTTRKLLWVEVQTGGTYDVADLPSGAFTQFTAIGSNGVTSGRINPSTYWTCAPEGSRMGFGDEDWLPGKKYAGAVEVYLPDDAAKVSNAQGYWEWLVR